MKDLNGIIVCFDPTSKAQANDVRIWCEYFSLNANLVSDGQGVIFAHGNLTAQHKPLSVRAGKRNLSLPIVNVNLNQDQDKSDQENEDIQTTAEIEFYNFVGSCYGHHPDADI